MTSKLVFWDYRNDESKWQKDWHSLSGDGIEVVALEDLRQIEHVGLLVVHASLPTLSNLLSVDDKRLRRLSGLACPVLVVRTGGFPDTCISADGQVCFSRTSFPGSKGGLLEMRDRVLKLLDRLEASLSFDHYSNAWIEFDEKPVGYDSVITFAILCQGYLLNFAFGNIEGDMIVAPISDNCVGEVLCKIGLTKPSAVWQVREEIRELKIALDDDLGSSFWEEPFSINSGNDWASVKNKIGEEVGGCPTAIATLIDQLEYATDISARLVAEAYDSAREALERFESK